MDLETGHEMLLGEVPSSTPHFSPNGQRIAVLGIWGDQRGIWILELADSSLTLLTPGAPSVSPVGQQVWNGEERAPLVLHWSDADTIYFTGKVQSDVWAVPASGGQPRLYVAIPTDCSAWAVVPEQRKVICSERHRTTDVWSVEALPASR